MSIKWVLFLITLLLSTRPTYAQFEASAIIEADVKISICGNDIIEGGEDCEKTNLGGRDCKDIGFTGGNLSCDIACTFDKSFCSNTKATTDTSPTSNISVSPTSSPGEILPLNPTRDSDVQDAVETQESILPPALQLFDIRGTGKILTQDLPVVVKLWVDEWRHTILAELSPAGRTLGADEITKCDVNSDSKCNLYDFSMLMFYVDR